MAQVKEFIFEAAELAFKAEAANKENRPAALKDWMDFVKATQDEYGVLGVQMALDVFDEIADRSGNTWEDFSFGYTYEDLLKIYKVAN
jgi:hypothetical protein